MITSTMGRMADAEKLDIPQLQQPIKNGTIPAYIGVPMLKDKIQQRQQAMAAAQAQAAPQQAPIAQEVMQAASGIDQVPTNLPVQAMNDGGIVAFAGGGDADEEDFDYDEYVAQQEEADHQQEMANDEEAIMALAEHMPSRGYRDSVNRTPDVEGGIKATPIGKEFYKTMYTELKDRAERMGLPNPEVIARVGAAQSALETGYGKHLAGGQNYFGIKGSGGNKQRTMEYSPEGGMRASNESFRQYGGMGESAEDYLRLMQNPRYRKVLEAQTPEEAIRAQGRSGYATDPRYGTSLRSIHLANMASGGITGLAHGGVAHYEIGGKTEDEYTPSDEFDYVGINEKQPPTWMESLKQNLGNIRDKSGFVFSPKRSDFKVSDAELGIVPPSVAESSDQAIRNANTSPAVDLTGNRMAEYEPISAPVSPAVSTGSTATQESPVPTVDVSGRSPASAASAAQPVSPQRNAYDEFMDYFKKGREDLKAQKQEDKYMAILQAGLGMMSGTSPNAMANIGQGASMGIASYGAAAKQRAAEENALMKGMISAQRYKEMGEDRREIAKMRAEQLGLTREASKERTQMLHDEKTLERDRREREDEAKREGVIGKNIADRTAKIEREVQDMFKNNPVLATDKNADEKMRAEINRRLANDDFLKRQHALRQKLYQKVYGLEYEMPDYGQSAAAPSSNRIRVDASGNIIK